MTINTNIHAVFIGDQAENGDRFAKILNQLVQDHLSWRKDYLPTDRPGITEAEQKTPDFIATDERMSGVMNELSRRLRSGSVPWNSAGRYWGQMNSETLLPAIAAYSFAMLWNPNNVALESSMATSEMEAEIGADFAKLFDFNEGWGHISADGSIANLEGIWYARCVKSIPLALQKVLPEKVAGKSEWQLLNMSVEEILEICESLTPEEYDAVKAASSRSGRNIPKLGKWIVPQTKHYSWVKAADIIGVGLDQIVQVPVKTNYRQNVEELEKIIRDLAAQKTPILGVVVVVGTTEEGAIDEVDKVVALREKLKAEGIYFYIHCDAAYGGYGRSLFIKETGEFAEYDELPELYKQHNVFSYDVKISEDIYNGYKAIKDVESVTIDPHKMGYVPYAAGGIAIKYKAMRNIISYFAPYVFEKAIKAPDMLGAFTLEGSRAGATAAAVWAAHRCVPLDITGYGRLTATSIEAAWRFRDFLSTLTFNINGMTIKAHPLNHPDLNMVDWVFKIEGETSLAATNNLNEEIFKYSSYLHGNDFNNRFLTSHTAFSTEDYGDSPLPFLTSIGFSEQEWKNVKSVTLLRAAIMTPYLTNDALFDYYATSIKQALEQRITEVLGNQK
ncbi:tyrosine decarboxylase [Wohlfahrtiimonas chitiniclastica]|uniref:tyrosine decarboxylase n=1 Tax=Wohlfahrtiimonas chitiniclastica TaxID=400946 RepID=UPI000B99249C|nr:tyrosine decarboxylase [Wohlfahrtiimonas chitiniclastica]OYQ78388.1 tyrosine decarboxylase [Wohlfahrtiimonas chitiniclastica]